MCNWITCLDQLSVILKSLSILGNQVNFWESDPQTYGFQVEQLCLIKAISKCSNIADQLKILTDWFNDFVGKYDKLQSELVILKNSNSL